MKWQVQFKVINAKLKQEQQHRKKKMLSEFAQSKIQAFVATFSSYLR